MANDVIKLTWASDGDADEAELNLLDFVQGLTLNEGGWVPQVATGDQATVTETMTFHAKAMSHDQLAGYVQVLDDWIIKVGWSQDFTQRQFVWLNARWKSETGIRRTVVYSLSYSLGGSSPFGVYLRDDSFTPTLTIVIVRGAYWEDTAYVDTVSQAMVSTGGTSVVYLAGPVVYSVGGDVPARLRSLTFVTTLPQQRYAWIGFRSSRNGVLANFLSVWDLKDASFLLATSSDTVTTVDATAHSGTRVTTDFSAGTALANRIRINVGDVAPITYADQRGTYVCLLRAKMSDASIARVRASSGFSSASFSNPYYTNPRTTIQGTSWLLYNLGIIRLPAVEREINVVAVIMQQAAIIIDAERVSGSGALHTDCLILMPYNDSYANLDVGADSASSVIIIHPDNSAVAYDTSNFRQVALEQNNLSVPANDESPLIVVSTQTNTAHNLTDTVFVNTTLVRRWRTLRGTE